jgi:hypothetical protein
MLVAISPKNDRHLWSFMYPQNAYRGASRGAVEGAVEGRVWMKMRMRMRMRMRISRFLPEAYHLVKKRGWLWTIRFTQLSVTSAV